AGGSTTVNGTLDPAGSVLVPGGTLFGSGSIAGTATAMAGKISPGNSPGVLTVNGAYKHTAGFLFIELNGKVAGTQYDQLLVNGPVTLGGPLEVAAGFPLSVNDSFMILDNDGTDPITGTFGGLPEGGTLFADGAKLQISYQGGDGNDVALKVIS